LLSAFLACLAVLAGAVATVAEARAPFDSVVAQERTMAPCGHCDDCDRMPCPMPMADCVQVAPGTPPLIVATAIALPRLADGSAYGQPRDTSLSGLSPPPDPFPPRT
jgi:hypothetical protein